MNSDAYRALDWVPADYQPVILGLFTVIALGFFMAGPLAQIAGFAESKT